MTYEEAIRQLNKIKKDMMEGYSTDVINFAIETLGKAEKYAWHDLRKDPTDLPRHDNQVLLKCTDLEIYPYFTAFYDGDMWIEGEFEDLRQVCFHVIAWRDIEPLESDERETGYEM